MKTKFLSAIIVSAFLIGTIYLSSCGAGGADKEKTKEVQTTDGAYRDVDQKGSTEGLEETSDAPSTGEQMTDQSKDSKSAGNATTYASTPGDKTSELKVDENIPTEKTSTKIIKKAEISIQVKDFQDSRVEFIQMVKASGAYLSAENQSSTTYSVNDDMEIRIKPAIFDTMVESILTKAIFVDYSNITADDVTEEYVDAEARLKAKQDVETQYKEILKKASTIYEIMSVQEKINSIREEIEAYQAKLKFMDDKVSFSTIKLHFYEKKDEIAAPDTGFWHKTGKAFKTGWNGLLMFFIGIVYLWPLWLIALIALYLVFYFIKRKRRRRALKNQ
jgi:hypothetical protein